MEMMSRIKSKIATSARQNIAELKYDLAYANSVANAKANSMFGDDTGNFQMLTGVAKSLVVFGIMIGLGILILIKFRDSTTADSLAYNEMNEILSLFTDLRTWGGIVLIVIVGYIVLRYLGVFDKEA